MNQETWYHVWYPNVCFGIAASNGVVTKAAHVAKWMIGKTLQEIKPFLLDKKASVLEVKVQPEKQN